MKNTKIPKSKQAEIKRKLLKAIPEEIEKGNSHIINAIAGKVLTWPKDEQAEEKQEKAMEQLEALVNGIKKGICEKCGAQKIYLSTKEEPS